MTDKHSLNYEVRELKLGASFTNNKASQYHTIKYDFKPASVDVNKMATVDVGTNNQVTVTVPHLDGAGIPQTVFKGNQRPYTTKECVLIIDRVTGEITLEKLSSNIQVKKTRQETSQKPRPLTPVTTDFTNTTQRSSSRTRVATNRRTNPNAGSATGTQTTNPARFNGSGSNSGLSSGAGAGSSAGSASSQGKAPQNMVRSPQRLKTSPPQAAPWSGGGNSTLASLPMIGLDEALAPSQANTHSHAAPHAAPHSQHTTTLHNGYGGGHGAGASAGSSAVRPPYVPPERGHVHPPNPHPVDRQLTTATAVVTAPPPTEHIHNNHQQSIQQDESSSSSSSDSDSGSGSGSDSDSEDDSARSRAAAASARVPLPNNTATTNGTLGGGDNPPLLSDVLNDDLCLSESGSDSD